MPEDGEGNVRGSHPELKAAGSIQSIAAASALESNAGRRPKSVAMESIPDRRSNDAVAFDEFISQCSFKRTTEIKGYSSTRIQFTFEPFKLTEIDQEFTLFLENQDYTQPIPIRIKGRCVNVPIYVEKEEYNLNVLVYDQFYREKIVLHNRSNNPMKI